MCRLTTLNNNDNVNADQHRVVGPLPAHASHCAMRSFLRQLWTFGGKLDAILGSKRRHRGRKQRILLAWELGGGMGHIRRLAAIGAELVAHGCSVTFALRELDAAESALDRIADRLVFRAPAYSGPLLTGAVCNYADVLYRSGYVSADALRPLVRAWQRTLVTANPALVVADHSPTVLLAAAGRIPVIHIGSGFATPPAGKPFKPLSMRSVTEAADRERAVLTAIRQVQTEAGAPLPDRVSDIFAFGENIPCTLPELDPYDAIRAERAAGPINPLPRPMPLAPNGFIFGYLGGEDERVLGLLESLVRAQMTCRIYFRKRPVVAAAIVAGSAVQLLDAPQPMPEILAQASAVLHHGGLSTAEAALAAGRMQFLFPNNLEQLLTANAIEALGCGLNVRRTSNPGAAIARALRQHGMRCRSAAVAEKLGRQARADVKALIVERCLYRIR